MKAIKRLVEADALKMEIIPNPKVVSVSCNLANARGYASLGFLMWFVINGSKKKKRLVGSAY